MKLEEMDTKLDLLDGKIEQMDRKMDEVIRLLLTPQGRRSSDMVECDLESCDFPLPMKPGRRVGRR